jgi:hypothetical protein
MYDSHPQHVNHLAGHPRPDQLTAGQSKRRRSGWLLFAVAVSAIAAGMATGQGLVLAAGLVLAPAGIHLISAPSRADAPGVRTRRRTAAQTAAAVQGHGDEVAVVHLQPVPLRAARDDEIGRMSADLATAISPDRDEWLVDRTTERSGPGVTYRWTAQATTRRATPVRGTRSARAGRGSGRRRALDAGRRGHPRRHAAHWDTRRGGTRSAPPSGGLHHGGGGRRGLSRGRTPVR